MSSISMIELMHAWRCSLYDRLYEPNKYRPSDLTVREVPTTCQGRIRDAGCSILPKNGAIREPDKLVSQLPCPQKLVGSVTPTGIQLSMFRHLPQGTSVCPGCENVRTWNTLVDPDERWRRWKRPMSGGFTIRGLHELKRIRDGASPHARP